MRGEQANPFDYANRLVLVGKMKTQKTIIFFFDAQKQNYLKTDVSQKKKKMSRLLKKKIRF